VETRSIYYDFRAMAAGKIILAIRASADGKVMKKNFATAKFNSMPLRAIAKKYFDAVSQPKEMSEEILQPLSKSDLLKKINSDLNQSQNKSSIDEIFHNPLHKYRKDCSNCKAMTLWGLIETHIENLFFKTEDFYLKYIIRNPIDTSRSCPSFLTNVGRFYRDTKACRKLHCQVNIGSVFTLHFKL